MSVTRITNNIASMEDGKDMVVEVDLYYPRSLDKRKPDEATVVEVSLMDVRAADSIRVRYDFERDGYQILQAQRFVWEDGEDPDSQWKEVAFVEAWKSRTDKHLDPH